MTYQEHYDEGVRLRNAFWASIGELEPDVLAPIINPAFMGCPAWPSLRQSFVTIKTPHTTILASDGLSDPYDDFDENPENQSYNGLGLEFYVESPDPIEEIKSSWQFSLLYQMSQQAASKGNLIQFIEKFKYVSMELYDVNVPDSYVNEHGRVGVLMGLPSAHIADTLALSLESIRIVNIRLLTLEELQKVIEEGETGRNALAESFIAKANAGYSSIQTT